MTTDFKELHPRIVLAVAAHPDDIDFTAGGTVATFTRQGAEVYYLILTDGGNGSSDPAITREHLRDTRRHEQKAACQALGAKEAFFCDYPDGFLTNSISTRRDVVRAIRHIKPDVVITFDPGTLYVAERGIVNHPDHRAAGQTTLDAIYPLARDRRAFPELLDEGLDPHIVKTVLLIRLDASGNFSVDISDCMEAKLAALTAHGSQFPDIKKTHNLATTWAQEAGAANGCAYAETFTRIDII